jgi:hypothetical protein
MTTPAAIPFWQLLTIVAIPTLMVFLGILTNRQDFHRVSARIEALTTQVHSDFMMVQSVLRDMEGRLSKVEARR